VQCEHPNWPRRTQSSCLSREGECIALFNTQLYLTRSTSTTLTFVACAGRSKRCEQHRQHTADGGVHAGRLRERAITQACCAQAASSAHPAGADNIDGSCCKSPLLPDARPSFKLIQAFHAAMQFRIPSGFTDASFLPTAPAFKEPAMPGTSLIRATGPTPSARVTPALHRAAPALQPPRQLPPAAKTPYTLADGAPAV
jgi:hypothetical protein